MDSEKFKRYTIDTLNLLKGLARKAKLEADNQKHVFDSYLEGVITGYYSIITLLKHEAFVFCVDQKELGLADIKPDVDLLGLARNPDADFEEDNWAIDITSEEKIKGYLSDSIALLKEQAKEAKLEADNPKNENTSYKNGYLRAYHTVIEFMKNETLAFNIDQEEIGLADIDPERDLM